MLPAANERRDDLRARRRERHAVTREPTAHEQTRAGVLSDVWQRIARKAHRPRPAMRGRCVDASLAKERLEVRLDADGRALFFADLFLDRGVAPAADEHPTVHPLPPVLITALRVRRARDDRRRRRRREHLPADWTDAPSHEV